MEYLLLITYPRTGSTVLNRVLNASPGHTIRGESVGAINHLCRFVRSLEEVKHNIPLLFPHLDSSDDRSPIWGADKITLSSVVNSVRNLVVHELLHPEHNTSVVGWKETMISPVYDDPEFAFDVLMFLRELLPDVRVIFNVRNSADVSKSSFWKYRQEAYWETEKWRKWIIGMHEEQVFGKDKSLLLDYDIWSSNPDILCSQLRRFDVPVNIVDTKTLLQEKLTHISDL